MFSLAHPLVLALAPLVVLAFWWRRRWPRAALGVPDGQAAAAAASGLGFAWLAPACRLAGLCLAVLALAGPRLGSQAVTYNGRGVDIVLAVDLSESMAALDFHLGERSVSRLAAVAEAAERFVAARPGDRIGLVAFGDRAYTVIPPTADHKALGQALSRLEVGAAGRRTALGDALGIAVKRLRDAPGVSKVAVLFSDGRSNAGEVSPEAAAGLAAQHGIKVYAVGVGGDEPAPFLVTHPLLGKQIVYEKADLDAATLEAVARATGGMFFRADDAVGLAEAAGRIEAMEKSDITVTTAATQASLAPMIAALAVLWLTTYAGLAGLRYVRLP